jgi:hypothetical protein
MHTRLRLEGDEVATLAHRTATTEDGRCRQRRKAFSGLALAGAVGLSLLAAACGGGSSSAKVAQVGTTGSANNSASSSATGSDDPTAYSRCMRSHGVGNFPDPDSNNVMRTAGIDKNSPTYKAAARACRSLAPTSPSPAQQAQLQAQMLAFAKCIRSHGVQAFPDPQVENGAVQLKVNPGQIDPNSPIVKAAIDACRSKFVGKGGAIEAQKLVQGLGSSPNKVGRRRGN